MKIVCISDTHGHTNKDFHIPDGDVIVHAGDLTAHGSPDEFLKFIEWFVQLPHKHKVFIAGNHDFVCEKHPKLIDDYLKEVNDPGLHYLNESGVVIDGVKFWGSPWTPRFGNWAFVAERG